MAENLKTTWYGDSASVTNVIDGWKWINMSTHGHSWYNNDASAYKDDYGAL